MAYHDGVRKKEKCEIKSNKNYYFFNESETELLLWAVLPQSDPGRKGRKEIMIAASCTLCHLVAKIAGMLVMEDMADLLAPRQLGYGVSGVAEAAVHAARQYICHLQPQDAECCWWHGWRRHLCRSWPLSGFSCAASTLPTLWGWSLPPSYSWSKL